MGCYVLCRSLLLSTINYINYIHSTKNFKRNILLLNCYLMMMTMEMTTMMMMMMMMY